MTIFHLTYIGYCCVSCTHLLGVMVKATCLRDVYIRLGVRDFSTGSPGEAIVGRRGRLYKVAEHYVSWRSDTL